MWLSGAILLFLPRREGLSGIPKGNRETPLCGKRNSAGPKWPGGKVRSCQKKGLDTFKIDDKQKQFSNYHLIVLKTLF